MLKSHLRDFQSRAPSPPCYICEGPPTVIKAVFSDPPPVLEIKLQHEIVGQDWACPYAIRWLGEEYSFVSAVMHQENHWSSRNVVGQHLYGGQMLEKDGWKCHLHRLQNTNDSPFWSSGKISSPSLLYFIQRRFKNSEALQPLPPTGTPPSQAQPHPFTGSLPSSHPVATLSPKKRPNLGEIASSPSKRSKAGQFIKNTNDHSGDQNA